MKELRTRLRAVIVPVSVGLIFIIIVAFGLVYFQQGTRQSELGEDIAQARRIASQARQSATEVESQFERAEAAIPAADLKETDVYRVVLELAAESNVKAEIVFKSEGQRKVLNASYRTLSFTLTAQGSYEAVRGFVETLERQKELETLVLENLKITTGEQASVSVDFLVYTHLAEG